MSIEISILRAIQDYISNPFLDRFFVTYTGLGDLGIIWIIIILFFLFNKQTRKMAILMTISLVFEFVLNDFILKEIIARPRPFLVHDVALLIEAPTSFAFPSGHSASSFAVVMVPFFMKFNARWWLVLLASLMAFSRLYLFVHWPTDVLAGILLGTFIAFVCVQVAKRINWLTSTDESISSL